MKHKLAITLAAVAVTLGLRLSYHQLRPVLDAARQVIDAAGPFELGDSRWVTCIAIGILVWLVSGVVLILTEGDHCRIERRLNKRHRADNSGDWAS